MRFMLAMAAAGALAASAASAADAAQGSKELHQAMMKGAAEMKSMKMTGDPDHDFVAAMKMHHQDAIAMAKVVLQSGKDPQAKEFAQKIIDSQSKEIEQFDAWLAQHQASSSK